MFVPIDINCRECAVTLMGFRDNEAHIQNSRQRGLTVTQRRFSFLAICSFLTVELQNEFPTSHYKWLFFLYFLYKKVFYIKSKGVEKVYFQGPYSQQAIFIYI